ncbi:MAG: glycosyltransferase [Acidimicrobiia bacterium]|nr:MAG: glycosyltransferase [Acidimicrobiia bacterium]
MKVVVQTVGTRGDVEPFVALGLGLVAAGHEVTVATAPSFDGFVSDRGLDFAPIRADYYELLDSPEAQAALKNPLKMRSMINDTIKPLMRRMLEDQASTSDGADLIVFHPKAMGATHVGELRRIPVVAGLPVPAMIPTADFPLPGFSVSPPTFLNRASYRLLDLSTAPFNKIVAQWRVEDLGLPPREKGVGNFKLNSGDWPPTLLAVSPTVVPKPADWPAEASVPGYWFLDSDMGWTPPADLVDFIGAGPPPVAVGFGSLVVRDPQRLVGEMLAGIRASGHRVVLVTGRTEFDIAIADDVYVIGTIPNHWLYPKMAAVIHHGGAGTTAAGLRAGTPTIITPVMGDQTFWGKRVSAIGAGPDPIAAKKISASTIESLVRRATQDQSIVDRAADVGEAIRAEDGTGTAIDIIETRRQHY